jgi:hypothetical protein
MGAEHHGWIREMQDAIAQLRLEDDDADGHPQQPTDASKDDDAEQPADAVGDAEETVARQARPVRTARAGKRS